MPTARDPAPAGASGEVNRTFMAGRFSALRNPLDRHRSRPGNGMCGATHRARTRNRPGRTPIFRERQSASTRSTATAGPGPCDALGCCRHARPGEYARARPGSVRPSGQRLRERATAVRRRHATPVGITRRMEPPVVEHVADCGIGDGVRRDCVAFDSEPNSPVSELTEVVVDEAGGAEIAAPDFENGSPHRQRPYRGARHRLSLSRTSPSYRRGSSRM